MSVTRLQLAIDKTRAALDQATSWINQGGSVDADVHLQLKAHLFELQSLQVEQLKVTRLDGLGSLSKLDRYIKPAVALLGQYLKARELDGNHVGREEIIKDFILFDKCPGFASGYDATYRQYFTDSEWGAMYRKLPDAVFDLENPLRYFAKMGVGIDAYRNAIMMDE